jgi:predicted nucleotidyltransferase
MRMLDEFSVLSLVASRLERRGIAYMVTGSVAVSLYAEPRMTRDVDVVVDLGPDDTQRFVALFDDEFTCDADRIQDAIGRRAMFNLIHTNAVVKIDFIVRKDHPYREEEFRRRRLVELDGIRLWVVSAEDLILSKLDWARDSRSELQLRDVKNVIRAQPGLDWPYIETWSARLGLEALLREARR